MAFLCQESTLEDVWLLQVWDAHSQWHSLYGIPTFVSSLATVIEIDESRFWVHRLFCGVYPPKFLVYATRCNACETKSRTDSMFKLSKSSSHYLIWASLRNQCRLSPHFYGVPLIWRTQMQFLEAKRIWRGVLNWSLSAVRMMYMHWAVCQLLI